MKKLTTRLTLLIGLIAGTAGCLQSPLLNHADADALGRETQLERESACALSFAAQGFCASLHWITRPGEDAPGEFQLRFWRKSEATEAGPYSSPTQSVGVKLWMPSMGHGSSPVQVSPAKDASGAVLPGIYDARSVNFVMGGAWEIWVQLKEGRQVVEQAKIDIEI